jgi:hypothetical protein
MIELINDVGFWQFIACVFFAIILINLMNK